MSVALCPKFAGFVVLNGLGCILRMFISSVVVPGAVDNLPFTGGRGVEVLTGDLPLVLAPHHGTGREIATTAWSRESDVDLLREGLAGGFPRTRLVGCRLSAQTEEFQACRRSSGCCDALGGGTYMFEVERGLSCGTPPQRAEDVGGGDEPPVSLDEGRTLRTQRALSC